MRLRGSCDHDDVWVPRSDLSACLYAFLQEPKSQRLVLLRQPACQDAQVNPTGGTLRGGFRQLDFRICKQHRRWKFFLFLFKGGSPLPGPTLACPFFSLRVTRLLRSLASIPHVLGSNGFTSVAACYGDLVLNPEASPLYPLPSLQASHTPGRLRSQKPSLPHLALAPAQ